MEPCKYIDHESEFHGCELRNAAPMFPEVKYWERCAPYEGAATKVQFCGKGRGRINNIFGCYGEMSCYEPLNS